MNPFRFALHPIGRRVAVACAGAALIIAAAMPSPARSQELGRLFFTPEQRQMLDRQRLSQTEARQEIPIPEDPTLTINGIVTRSSGKRTVWINGIAQDESHAGGGVTVTPLQLHPGKIIVHADKVPPARTSVGATVNRNTGESVDILGGGSIRSKTSPPP